MVWRIGVIAPAIDGARASGGPVVAGGTCLVGERGPELFAPKRDGSILPANITRLLKSTAVLGAAAYTVPAAATPNLGAYTLPEPTVQAIMQSRPPSLCWQSCIALISKAAG